MQKFTISYLSNDINLQNSIQNFIDDWRSESEFIENQTSGSTGKPKKIQLKKKHMKASAQMSGAYFNFSEGKKIMLSLSIDTIGGKMIVVRAMEFNMTLIVTDILKNPIKLLNESIYFLSLVPYQLQAILEESPDKINLIQNILLGGAPVSEYLTNQIQTLLPSFFESFGMTETMSHVAIKNLKLKTNIFEALGQTNFTQESDSLVINAPELGIRKLQTNDQVHLIDETHFVWLGRKDFAINSGGKKFHPELLERKLENSFPYRYFIHKELDEKLGERIIMFIEHKPSTSLYIQIQQIVSSKLEKHEIPKQIYFAFPFIETNSGKINRIETYDQWCNEH